jgi:hypothetical protein
LEADGKMESQESRVSDNSLVETSQAGAGEAELQLQPGRFELTWPDWLLAPVIALLAGVWVFPYVGTSVHWDDLFYMNLSQYTTPQAVVLNRYGHIYLQKLFFWLTGDAITGGRVYWCFLIFSTCVLVYWCAKILTGKRGYIVGLAAVLFFCAQPFFGQQLGCAYSDFTVMFLVTLGIFVYLAFLSGRQKYKHLFIMMLGLIFFWAVKSKETGICMAVLFLGLGEDRTGSFSVRRFARDIGWIYLGILAGLMLLMLLDVVFMGDAWFSIRPSNIKGVFAYNTGEFAHDEKGVSLYRLLSGQPLLPAFLLYLFVGCRGFSKNLPRHKIAVWLIPLVVMFFLIAVSIRARTASPWRAFTPAIPGVCIWAVQYFRFRSPEGESVSLSKKLTSLVIVLSAFIIVAVVMHNTPELIRNTGWGSLAAFYVYVILPLATTGLLICAGTLRKRGLMALFLVSLCLFFIVYFPSRKNLTTLKQRVVAKISEKRFMPYRVFGDELRFGGDVVILVSKDVHARSWMLGQDVKSHCSMFNIFFNQKFDFNQFIDELGGHYQRQLYLCFSDPAGLEGHQ